MAIHMRMRSCRRGRQTERTLHPADPLRAARTPRSGAGTLVRRTKPFLSDEQSKTTWSRRHIAGTATRARKGRETCGFWCRTPKVHEGTLNSSLNRGLQARSTHCTYVNEELSLFRFSPVASLVSSHDPPFSKKKPTTSMSKRSFKKMGMKNVDRSRLMLTDMPPPPRRFRRWARSRRGMCTGTCRIGTCDARR